MLIKAGILKFSPKFPENSRVECRLPRKAFQLAPNYKFDEFREKKITANEANAVKERCSRLRLIKIHSELYLFSCLFNYYRILITQLFFMVKIVYVYSSRMLCPFVC